MTWTDIEDICIALDETHPEMDPLSVRFTDLRAMVEALEEFEAEADVKVNEQILEAIQAGWAEERQDRLGEDDDEDGRSYQPVNPYRL